MTIKYFNVKGGLVTGNITLDGTSGNVTIGNAALGNLVTANYFSGDGSLLSAINGANVTGQVGNALLSGTVYTNAQPNITSVGTLSSLTVTANISSGNANLGNLATASYFTGNGYLLAGITGANIDGNVTSAVQSHYANIANSVSGSNVSGQVANALVAGTVYTNAQPNITSVGTLSSLIVTANANVGNLNVTSNVYATNFIGNVVGNISGNITVTGNNTDVLFNDNGNIGASDGMTFNKSSNLLTVTGNLTVNNANLGNLASANYISGNGSLLSAITGANVTGTVSSATSATTAGTVTTGAQPNITSTGTLVSLDVTGNVGAGNFVATGGGSFNANVNLNSNHINNVADPHLDQDAATKKYVDGLVSTGLYYHSPVTAATTTTLAVATGGTITYNNGTAGVNANLVTTGSFDLIDTANVQTVGTRILVKNEANATWNGVYIWEDATTIKRSTDADSYGPGTGDLSLNDYFFVNNGSVNKGSAYVVTTTGTITFGTTNIDFSQFSTSQVYNAGQGLTLTDLTFNVNNAQPNITSVGTLTALTVSSNIFAPAIVQNASTYDTRVSLNSGAGIVEISANGYATKFGPAGSIELSGAAQVISGTFGGSGITLGTSQTDIFQNRGGNVTIQTGTGGSTANTWTFAQGGNLIGTGNVNAGYFIGNGSQLTSITGSSVSGNVTSAVQAHYANIANSVSGGNVTGQVGNALIAGTVYTNAQPNITSVGTLASLSVTANVSAGNVLSDNILYANGAPYDFVANASGSNTQVQFNDNDSFGSSANFTFNKTSNTLSVTNIIANGAGLTSITGANVSGTVANANYAAYAGEASTVTSNAQPNITSTGTLSSLTITGNVTAGNASLGNLVTASYFSGSGNLLANIQGANVTGAVGSATNAGTVTTGAQPNITSVGTLTSLNVTGNIISGNVKLNGALISNRANVAVTTDTIIDEFPTGSYRTAKYVVSAKGADGYQSAEVILVQDGSSSFISIYGSVCSNNTADIVDFTSNVDGISGNARLYATTSSASTTVNLVKIYVPD